MAEIHREIIFDTETTGLDAREGDRVIEIGAIELVNRFPTGKTFHMFLNPEERDVHPEALEIHGISNEFLRDKPTFRDAYDSFEAFFSQGKLIAHNASFDLGFLNAELERLEKPPINPDRVVDTLQIARRKFPGQRNSLDALCSRFGIDNSRREKHGALLDSELLAEVYLELLGGKQASLTLEHVVSETASASGFAGNGSRQGARTRPSPLAPRITDEDLARHREFVSGLGGETVWKKSGLL